MLRTRTNPSVQTTAVRADRPRAAARAVGLGAPLERRARSLSLRHAARRLRRVACWLRPLFPRQRFSCGPAEGNFVGTTIIEDQNDRARRCLWANPSPGGLLTLTFANVPMSEQLSGYIGFPYFRFRDHGWPKVSRFVCDRSRTARHA